MYIAARLPNRLEYGKTLRGKGETAQGSRVPKAPSRWQERGTHVVQRSKDYEFERMNAVSEASM